eukprot:TRINITY_DN108628_c0_g1_i1.p1 TRINITY_DN108628_c0_g1~~TRINITY_DN108628_c0_g1_i1.p1  ORF type:complete len:727 (+),score=95.68 TRINITY_DN108628_c0_g1_i1:54-2183(+)
MALGAALTGLLLYMLPYGWDYPTCLAIGSVLAATDPVAVVNLLKELGASPALTMIIEGESMLNDGTAVVFFTVAYDLVAGVQQGPIQIMMFVLGSTLGAALLGGLVGSLGYRWIRGTSNKLRKRNAMIQILVTLCCAYWSFIVAEGVFHVSGILSTVASSVVLAHKMWPRLVESQAMREVWLLMGTVANCVVFFLAGVFACQAARSDVPPLDYMLLPVCYLGVMFIRFAMLLLCWPLLNCAAKHERLSLKDLVIMTWGGLRGMVGLAFAILIKKDLAAGALSSKDGDRIFFLVAGIVAITLLINATTCPALVHCLHGSGTALHRVALVKSVARIAEEHVEALRAKMQLIRSSRSFGLSGAAVEAYLAEPEEVRNHMCRLYGRVRESIPTHDEDNDGASGKSQGQSATHPSDEATSKLWSRLVAAEQELVSRGGSDLIADSGLDPELHRLHSLLQGRDLDTSCLSGIRHVFLTCVSMSYLDQVSHQIAGAGHLFRKVLRHSVNLAKEHASLGLIDWQIIHDHLPKQVSGPREPIQEILQRATAADPVATLAGQACHCISRRSAQKEVRSRMRTFHLIMSFLEAQSYAQQQVATFYGNDASADTPEEAFVILESCTNVLTALSYLCRIVSRPLQSQFSHLVEVRVLVDAYRNFVCSTLAGGILRPLEAADLLRPLEAELSRLEAEQIELPVETQRDVSNNSSDASEELDSF